YAVMNELEMPAAHPGMQIYGDQRFAEEIVARAIRAEVVTGGRFDGQICQVQLWIYGDLGPRSRVACVFGGTVKPCLNAILAWHGDSVENPQSFTRTNVKATNIAFDVADTAWIAASTVRGVNNNH